MVLLGAVSALLIVALLAAARHSWPGTRRSRRGPRPARRPGPGAEAALRRHPAGRGRHAAMVPGELGGPPSSQWPPPVGPDDDPEFIDALGRLIHGDGDGI
jgi:hypothetical protein